MSKLHDLIDEALVELHALEGVAVSERNRVEDALLGAKGAVASMPAPVVAPVAVEAAPVAEAPAAVETPAEAPVAAPVEAPAAPEAPVQA